MTGTTYSDLQGFDPTLPFTFTWDGFASIPETTSSPLLFNIVRTSDFLNVFNQFPLSNTSTSVLLPANTLESNTTYRFDLAYRHDIATNTGFGTATGLATFSTRTFGQFTTAPASIGTPEPSSLLGLGLLGLGLSMRRTKGK